MKKLINLPIKILIADDEQEARELLIYYLQQSKERIEIFESVNGVDTAYKIKSMLPDIVFLDVKMPEMSGLEVLAQCEKKMLPVVIFTTAYDAYALPAFDFEAVDYLLKPFEKERFERSLVRGLEIVNSKRDKKRKHLSIITVRAGQDTLLIPVEDIMYFQAEGDYIKFFTENRSYLVKDAIYKLNHQLDEALFLRVHRGVIINIKYIKSIRSLPSGDHLLALKNGITLRASRTFRKNLEKFKHQV